MYLQPFFINTPVGNNAFAYDKREIKSIYVPNLIEINDINEVILGDEIAFSDIDFDGKLDYYKGLKNFYKYKFKNKYVYIFDNHNHAFYFWGEELNKGNIKKGCTLIHIDEHADTRDPGVYFDNYSDLKGLFEYTNFVLNVGNYIIPAIKNGLLKEVIQIRSETRLNDYLKEKIKYDTNIILNLDLDFFEPNLDFIDYNLKKKVILDAMEKRDTITICTSPFFIDQNFALKVLKDLF